MKCSIIVPCFNEESRLDQNAFVQFAQNNPQIYFHFVNDGSQDRTPQVLAHMCENHPQFSFLNLQKNGGKAEAVRLAMLDLCKHNQFDFLGYWDADLATPLDEIPNMLRCFELSQEIQIVAGSRISRLGSSIKRNPKRHYLGRIFATIAGLMLNVPIYDTQCGAKILRQNICLKVFTESFVSRWFFDVEVFFRLKNLNSSNQNWGYELPLQKWEDVKGSKVKLRDFLKVPWELLKIYRHYRC